MDKSIIINTATLTGHKHNVECIAITPNGKYIISGSRDNTIKIWNINSYKCLATLTGHNDCVGSIAITPNGNYIISGSGDNTIKIWDIIDPIDLDLMENYIFSALYLDDFYELYKLLL